MKNRWSWTAFLLPNLLLGLSHTPALVQRNVFDEGYFGVNEQVWIKFESGNTGRFSGVWANRQHQKNISGEKVGKLFIIRRGHEKWVGETISVLGNCEPYLHMLSPANSSVLVLKGNFCERSPQA